MTTKEQLTDMFKRKPWLLPALRALKAKGKAADEGYGFMHTDPRDVCLSHPGALSLVLYAKEGEGNYEIVWNSTDHEPPYRLQHSRTGEWLEVVPAQCFVPQYTPAIGERVCVEMTEQRARIISQELVGQLQRGELRPDAPARIKQIVDRYTKTRTDFAEQIFPRMTEALLASGVLDVIHVTQGWLDDLAAQRHSGKSTSVIPIAEFPEHIRRAKEAGILTDHVAAEMMDAVANADSTGHVFYHAMPITKPAETVLDKLIARITSTVEPKAKPS